MFFGPQKKMNKLRHYSGTHFKHQLLADLKDKSNPPYLCPFHNCPFQTESIQSWTRHYGVTHNQIQKYLNNETFSDSVNSDDRDEYIHMKINNLGLKSQKIKDECIEELNKLIYHHINPSEKLSAEKGLQEPIAFELNFNDSIIENDKLDVIYVENDEDLDSIDSSLPWL